LSIIFYSTHVTTTFNRARSSICVSIYLSICLSAYACIEEEKTRRNIHTILSNLSLLFFSPYTSISIVSIRLSYAKHLIHKKRITMKMTHYRDHLSSKQTNRRRIYICSFHFKQYNFNYMTRREYIYICICLRISRAMWQNAIFSSLWTSSSSSSSLLQSVICFYAAAKSLMNKHAIDADVTRGRGKKRMDRYLVCCLSYACINTHSSSCTKG